MHVYYLHLEEVVVVILVRKVYRQLPFQIVPTPFFVWNSCQFSVVQTVRSIELVWSSGVACYACLPSLIS